MRPLSEATFIARHKLKDGRVEMEIDTRKVIFRGYKWKEMTAYKRRRFENMLVLENPKTRLCFTYLYA